MTRLGRIAIPTVAVATALIVAIAFAAASDDNAGAPGSTVEPGTPTSTTVAPSTTLETTTTSTTSTTRPFVPRPTGTVIPYETGIYIKGATFDAYAFGDDSSDVLAGVAAALGDADRDTGWRKDDTCEGSSTRRVVWDDLELVFTKGANGLLPDSLTFQQWHISGTTALVKSAVTPEGIGIGSTVADLKHAYPDAKVTRARASDEAGIYLTRPEGGPFIQGFTKDTSDKSLITSMWAGLACQRILG
jgi:hypothetical protein